MFGIGILYSYYVKHKYLINMCMFSQSTLASQLSLLEAKQGLGAFGCCFRPSMLY